jgi:signal transduction histidine kinase
MIETDLTGPYQAAMVAAIPECNPNPILVIDRDGAVLYRNPAAARLLAELRGADADVASMLPKDYLELIRSCLDSGQEVRRILVAVDNQWLGWSIYPMPGSRIAHLYGSDVTSAKHAEQKQEQLKAQLLQCDKMASIGQLAAGIAHEINNPLSFIMSNLHALHDYLADIRAVLRHYEGLEQALAGHLAAGRAELHDCRTRLAELATAKASTGLSDMLNDLTPLISETQDGVERIRTIVQGLKEFTHAGEEARKHADLNRCLQSTLKIVWNELKYKTEVVEEYGPIPELLCYPQKVNQVFMNLLINAAQAIRDKGTIRIRTFERNGGVAVEIADTGCGIPPDHLDRIFEPFFTTKEVGRGTGLGLAISYGIVEKHRGRIEVESAVGTGSTFRVWFPLDQPEEDKGPP